MSQRTLLYFVKYPEPGKVKTRLARTVGAAKAAELYRELAEKNFKLLQETAGSEFSLQVAYDPPESEERIQSWLAGASRFFPQKGDGLGERLRQAFDSAFREGARQVIALGSDTLGLKPELISRAFEELENYDAVLGPAKDGGYYLIGLGSRLNATNRTAVILSDPKGLLCGAKDLILRFFGLSPQNDEASLTFTSLSPRFAELFREIPWSTDRVLAETIERIKNLGLSYLLLEELEDLDELKAHLSSLRVLGTGGLRMTRERKR